MVKNPPANAGDIRDIRSLGQKDPVVEDVATHSSNLAWRAPMDRGAWWFTVYSVAKSQTRLKWLSMYTYLQGVSPQMQWIGLYNVQRSGANKICKMTRHIKSIKSEDIYVRICWNLLKVDIHIPENTNLFFLYRNRLDVYQLRCVTEAHDFSSKEIITFWQVC